MHKNIRSFFFVPLLIVLASSLFSLYTPLVSCRLYSTLVQTNYEELTENLKRLMESVSMEKIMEHISYFASLQTRVIGTQGFYEAAEYIRDMFSQYGLKPGPDGFYHRYPHTITIQNYANLTVESEGLSLRLLTVWPNLVSTSKTPPEGLEGELLLVEGSGSLEDFDGKDVAGKIVVMNYDSGSNWINAAKLGAKAVIFLPAKGTVIGESLSKFIQSPLYFPRYYAAYNETILYDLAVRGSRAKITSNMHWEIVNGINVLGVIEGSDSELRNDIIIISSHFDSWSPVPEIAPGAEEACGISVLLEIARIMAESAKSGLGPKRTVWFVALSGHWQALAGARNFVMDYLFSGREGGDWPYTTPSEFRVYAWIGLDLSTGSDKLGLLFPSLLYRPLNLRGFYDGRIECLIALFKQKGFLKNVLDTLKEISPEYSGYNVIFGDEDRTKDPYPTGLKYGPGEMWGGLSFLPSRDFVESEPAMVAGTPALTLRTVCDYRPYLWTLSDNIKNVKVYNLKPQALFSLGFIWVILNVPRDVLGIDYETKAKPTDLYTGPGYVGIGLSAVRGNLQIYDPLTDRFDDFKTNQTGLVIVTNQPWDPRSYIIAAVNREGTFLIKGLGSPSIYYGYAGAIGPSYEFHAFIVENETGLVTMVDMEGIHSSGRFIKGGPSMIGIPSVYRHGYPLKLPVYRPASIVIFDAVSPYILSSSPVDPVSGDPVDIVQLSVNILIPFSEQIYPKLASMLPPINVVTGAENEYYAGFQNEFSNVWVIYVTPYIKTGLKMIASDRSLLGLFINATEVNPYGEGLILMEGEEIRVTPIEIVEDLVKVNEQRIKILRSYEIMDSRLISLHETCKEYLEGAKQYLKNNTYSKAYSFIYTAWLGESQVYNGLIRLHYDITATSVFFASLLLPFAYIMERIVYGKGGYRSLTIVCITISIVYLLFTISHPGFALSSSPITIVIGFAIVILLIPIFSIFFGEALTAFREVRRKLIGKHEEEISRLSQVLAAFSLGTGYMKKRPFRTTLTMLTLIILISSLTSLTSMSTLMITQYTPLSGPSGGSPIALYTGVHIKRIGFGPISQDLMDTVKLIIGEGAKVDFQVWYYPNFNHGVYTERKFEVTNKKGSYSFQAILGLTPGLIELYRLGDYMEPPVPLSWSMEEDIIPVLLPRTASDMLGLSIKDVFTANGLRFFVAGIFNDTLMDSLLHLVDLDQDRPTPIDLSMYTMGISELAALPSPNRLLKINWGKVMIVPAERALHIGGKIRAISATFPNGVSLNINKVYTLIDIYGLEIVIGKKDAEVTLLSRRNLIQISGLSMLIIPLIIVIFAVFNALLASVYERTREMKIFSIVGLSPTSVTGLFLVEALAYAILSAVIGYVTGVGILKILFALSPIGFTPNYSSASVAVAIGLSLLAILASSMYPALKAGTMVTPSLERRWKIPTKPIGGVWEIPLPFYTDNETEAAAILLFLKEYLDANTVERSGSPFASSSTVIERVKGEGGSLKSIIRLAPFDSGLVQFADLKVLLREGKYMFLLKLEHKSGPLGRWEASARNYIRVIREQMLLWRSLTPRERRAYLDMVGD